MPETTPIDRAVLNNLLTMFNGDKTFVYEVIGTYLEDGARLISNLEQALAAGNAEDLRRAAHSLKSNSANLGAMTLADLSRELEAVGKTGMLTEATSKAASVKTEFERVQDALEKIRAEGL
jgi:HPt (histidine-containing phosphotransfer) domain-containing protein